MSWILEVHLDIKISYENYIAAAYCKWTISRTLANWVFPLLQRHRKTRKNRILFLRECSRKPRKRPKEERKKEKKKRKEKKEEDWSVGTQVHVIRLFCVSVDREHTKWSALARLEGWQGGIKSSTVLEPASTVYVGEILLKNGTENWLGKKTSSHLITGPFPSLFLLFRSRVRNDEQPRVEEGSNYATAVSPDNIKCPPRTVSSL